MKATAGIRALAAASSPRATPVEELAAEAALGLEEVETLWANGLERVPVASVRAAELIAELLNQMCEEGAEERIDSVALTHSLELGAGDRAELELLLRRRLPALAHPPLIVAGRPCSVLHLGVELGARHVAAGGAEALVLGLDIAPSAAERFFFGSAMGDAAVGLTLGAEPGVGRLLAVRSSTHVLASEGTASPPEAIQRFRTENPVAIRALIERTLAEAGLGWAELAAIVPHTPYRLIWDTVAEISGFPREQIVDDRLPETGHLNSNDVLAHLLAATASGRVAEGDAVALVSPGFGGTRGCTVLRWGAGGGRG